MVHELKRQQTLILFKDEAEGCTARNTFHITTDKLKSGNCGIQVDPQPSLKDISAESFEFSISIDKAQMPFHNK